MASSSTLDGPRGSVGHEDGRVITGSKVPESGDGGHQGGVVSLQGLNILGGSRVCGR